MQFPHTTVIVWLFAIAVTSPALGAERHTKPLTNQPPDASIVRFEAARLSAKRVAWRALPRQDGEFIMSSCRALSEWTPTWPGGGVPGCVLPPPNEFAVRAVTKSGQEYYMTFTTQAESVWIGDRLLDVPGATSTQVVQRVQRALKQK